MSLEQLLALLEAARGKLTAGWVQGTWWSVPGGGGHRRPLTGLAAGISTPDHASAVCLVGALVWSCTAECPAIGSENFEVGKAIGAIYDTLWESRGQASGPGPGLLTAHPPRVRLAQVQALTRWNDATGRTKGEVLAILDRAITRTMLGLMALPAPRDQALPPRERSLA